MSCKAEASRWHKLFVLTQKAHYKTGSIPKLNAAVQVYASLGRRSSIAPEVLTKLVSMLRHPFPRVSFPRSQMGRGITLIVPRYETR